MAAMTGRLMLLDSASLYFRAFFGVPDGAAPPDGTPVNAVRGFLDMIATLVGQLPADPPGGLLGQRLAAGVPGRRDPVLQGAPRSTEPASDVRRGEPGPRSTPQVPVIADVARGPRASPGSAPTATRPTTSSARWPTGAAGCGRSTSSPATATCSSSSTTTRGVRVLYIAPAACATSTWSTRRVCAQKYDVPSGPAVRRHGHPARRRQRRAAGRRRGRREDRGDADQPVRRPGRACAGRWPTATPAQGRPAGPARGRRGLPRRRRRGSSGSPWTRRCREVTTRRLPTAVADPVAAGRACAAELRPRASSINRVLARSGSATDPRDRLAGGRAGQSSRSAQATTPRRTASTACAGGRRRRARLAAPRRRPGRAGRRPACTSGRSHRRPSRCPRSTVSSRCAAGPAVHHPGHARRPARRSIGSPWARSRSSSSLHSRTICVSASRDVVVRHPRRRARPRRGGARRPAPTTAAASPAASSRRHTPCAQALGGQQVRSV